MGQKIETSSVDVVLTYKQREALNLLIQHMTSKEMARILGVSPHTVDQRIESAKRKFGAASRGELAFAYRQTLPVGDRLTHEVSHIAAPTVLDNSSKSDEPGQIEAILNPNRTGHHKPDWTSQRYRIVPEFFFGAMGTIYRLTAIILIAMLMVIVVLGGISIFVAMTEVLNR